MDRRYERLAEAAQEVLDKPRSQAARDKLSHILNFKMCKTCWTEKPFSEFGKQKTTFDGHRNHCKKCRSEARC